MPRTISKILIANIFNMLQQVSIFYECILGISKVTYMQGKGERTENKVQSHPQMMTCDTIFCDNCTLVSFTRFATFTPYFQLIS
jgi:hypothetical protein